MLIVISPAKSFSKEVNAPNLTYTQPSFIENSEKLIAKYECELYEYSKEWKMFQKDQELKIDYINIHPIKPTIIINPTKINNLGF